MREVTRILKVIEGGDAGAAGQLLPLVYDELRRLAAQKLSGERPGQTLQATALVHEAYVRLVGGGSPTAWAGRAHFFAAAAEAMRRILIDNARRKLAARHGGGHARVDMGADAILALEAPVADEKLIALSEALDALEGHDKSKAELVKLRYFGGLTIEEAAAVLDISRATADRYWSYARAWLFDRLSSGAAPGQ